MAAPVLAALIPALAAVGGQILGNQAERERSLEKMKYDALMKAIESQAGAYESAAKGQQSAYGNMMSAYRGTI
jgi:hypothetical protein